MRTARVTRLRLKRLQSGASFFLRKLNTIATLTDSDFLSENPHWFYSSSILMRTARVTRLRLKRLQSGANFFAQIFASHTQLYANKFATPAVYFSICCANRQHSGTLWLILRQDCRCESNPGQVFLRKLNTIATLTDSDFLSENPHWFYSSSILMRTARVTRLRLKRLQSGANFFLRKLNTIATLTDSDFLSENPHCFYLFFYRVIWSEVFFVIARAKVRNHLAFRRSEVV